MSKMSATCIVILLAGATALAGTPTIFCETPVADFGNVGEGQKTKIDFVIENRGDADLQIGKPKFSCGCTSGTFEAMTLAPGQITNLTVQVDASRKKAGRQRLKVEILSNDPNAPSYILRINGIVLPVCARR